MKSHFLAVATAVAAYAVAITPALAVTVAGGVDPATGLTQLLPYGLKIVGLGICGVGMWKGAHAAHDGRSVGPAVGGVLGGAGLAFGAPYLMTQYGIL